MATQAQLLTVLADAQSPMRQSEMGDLLKLKVSNFSGQLRTLEKSGFVSCDAEGAFAITDAGRGELQKLLANYTGTEDLPSEEEAGTTEMQQFIKLGKMTGVMPDTLIVLVANHVWTGDYLDITWVAKAMQEMGVRNDLASRWVNAWRGHLHQPMTEEVRKILKAGKDGDKELGESGDKGGRDYILSTDDTPTFVGEGLGDMTYNDAMKLANARAAGRARAPAAAAAAAESPLETLSKVLKVAQELQGEKTGAKTFLIKPGANGYEAEEMEAGKPLILPALGAAGGNQAPVYFFDRESQTLKELKPGEPLVLGGENKPAASKNYYVDQDGNVKEMTPGMPIVIIKQAPAAAGGTPIQLRDSQGNPVIMDIDTLITLEDHKAKQAHDEEKHKVGMEIATQVKELVGKFGKAMANMAEKE